ncbi:hypothetical protein ACFW2Y_03475 [Streptomyces sp. NPDC058877]|uniref:hypothetical protein n=1 Tax=unclassified Streptomyces TaxID=2593676 RepID=UPI0036BB6DE4
MMNRIHAISVALGTAALLAFGAVNFLAGGATSANTERTVSTAQVSAPVALSDSAWG